MLSQYEKITLAAIGEINSLPSYDKVVSMLRDLNRNFPILFVNILEIDSNYNLDMEQKNISYLLLQISF